MRRTLLLTCICILVMSCSLTGCMPNAPDQVAEGSSPTFKKYQSSSLSFDYPGTLYEQKNSNGNIIFMATSLDPSEDYNNLTFYDIQELVVINAVKKHLSRYKDSQELRKASIKEINQLGKVTFIERDGMLKDYIPVLEYILSSPQASLHIRQYFYCNKTGDAYVVTISTPHDNWNNIQEVVETLDRTVTFKD